MLEDEIIPELFEQHVRGRRRPAGLQGYVVALFFALSALTYVLYLFFHYDHASNGNASLAAPQVGSGPVGSAGDSAAAALRSQEEGSGRLR